MSGKSLFRLSYSSIGFVAGLLSFASLAGAQTPLGTAFTYQGQLKSGGSPANGSFSMNFRLFDAATGGNQVGPTLSFDGAGGDPPPITITNGLFTVPLDFGGAYDGNKRWLETSVNGTILSPRQELTAAPYSAYSSAPWTTAGASISYSAGNVGISTTTPTVPLSLGLGNANTKLAIWEDSSDPSRRMGLGVAQQQFRLHLPGSSNRFVFLDAPAGNEIVTIRGNGFGATNYGPTLEVVGNNPDSHMRITARDAITTPYGAILSLDAEPVTGGKDWQVFSSAGSAGEGQGKLEAIPKPDHWYCRMITHVENHGRTNQLVGGTDS